MFERLNNLCFLTNDIPWCPRYTWFNRSHIYFTPRRSPPGLPNPDSPKWVGYEPRVTKGDDCTIQDFYLKVFTGSSEIRRSLVNWLTKRETDTCSRSSTGKKTPSSFLQQLISAVHGRCKRDLCLHGKVLPPFPWLYPTAPPFSAPLIN